MKREYCRHLCRHVLCLALCLSMAFGLTAHAFADGPVRFGKGVIGANSGEPGNEDSVTARVKECNKKYEQFQEDRKDSSAGSKKLDYFTFCRTVFGKVRQVSINAASTADGRKVTYYSPLDDYNVIYYYDEKGLPYFALYTTADSAKEELRFFLSQGEVIKLIDSDKQEYYDIAEDFQWLYNHAVAAYSRAVYDRYGTGTYAVQAASFKDKDDAVDCCNALNKRGASARVEVIDYNYCVLIGSYKDWEKANKAADGISYPSSCDYVFVRLV
ncbi:MAG: SPOR domain-containing protein [Candidatus Limivicinus sp.]